MKIVLDCNVLISAGISDGVCKKVLVEVLQNHHWIVSPKIVDEYFRTIEKPRFKFRAHMLERIIDRVVKIADSINPAPYSFKLPDSDDEVYLATALTAEADVLVTGNKKHFPLSLYENTAILSPREFLDRYCQGHSGRE